MIRQLKPVTTLGKLGSKESLIIILILILLNIIVGFTIYKLSSIDNYSSVISGLNQTRSINGVSVTISDPKIETNYIMGIKPSENEEIISFKIQISNNSDRVFGFFPSITSFIRDSEGKTYQLTVAQIKDPMPAGTINPGQTTYGRLAYMVTSRDLPMRLYIENTSPKYPPFIFQIR